MSSTLESVKWGKSALELIKHTWELDPNVPAVMQIRHSERLPVTKRSEMNLPLTDTGEKTAYEFGSKLPPERKYYLHYTSVERTQKTASKLHEGVIDNKGISEIVGILPVTSVIDIEANANIAMQIKKGIEDDEGSRKYFYHWLSGLVPPWVREPSLEFSQQAAYTMIKNLREAKPKDMHIWVSHDAWVAPFLLHWLGECSFNWVSFMDGFILQFYESYMVSFFRGEKKKVEYPYWWRF